MDSTGSSEDPGVKSELLSPGIWSRAYLKLGGLLMSCACISIKNETLAISYTYCTLAFSRLMRWFEHKHRNFHDHRALFHAAPRYALLAWVIAIGPSIVDSW